MAKVSLSGGFKNIAFSLTEPRAHDGKITLVEGVVWVSEREDKRIKKLQGALANKG